MTRTLVIFIAFAGSLAVHLVVLAVIVTLRPFLFEPVVPESAWRHEDQIAVVLEEPTRTPKDTTERFDDFGDASGKGIGSNNATGDRPMQAREADSDQAFLSRDPIGQGRVGDPPSPWTGPVGADGTGPAGGMLAQNVGPTEPPKPNPFTAAAPPLPPEAPTAVESPRPAPSVDVKPLADPLPKLPDVVADAPPLPKPRDAQRSADADVISRPPNVTAVASNPNHGNGQKIGPRQTSTDPARESDSESDPFLRISGNVVFRDGRLDVRFGRKVKTTRPRLLIGGQIALYAVADPTIIFKVSIDPEGKVTDVQIIRSSGSNDLDQPAKQCIYDWWFEPAKDKSGKPRADVVVFGFGWR